MRAEFINNHQQGGESIEEIYVYLLVAANSSAITSRAI